jgi:NADH:ubiquinone oxidoreductase subunit F (NADH-binding)
MSSGEVIAAVKAASVRGRGGAGFPTGMKWEFARRAPGDMKYILCNADEGEPGTFKDRVILTERPQMVFEGMAIAAYAVGARQGILYVRNEYRYLRAYLEGVLAEMRAQNQLGALIAGQAGFHFDISIQFGAGAYVCGEESALIESAEGKRGEPRDRPPFPVEKGYLQKPTVVNNVETLCSVVQVMLRGADWYNRLGHGAVEGHQGAVRVAATATNPASTSWSGGSRSTTSWRWPARATCRRCRWAGRRGRASGRTNSGACWPTRTWRRAARSSSSAGTATC